MWWDDDAPPAAGPAGGSPPASLPRPPAWAGKLAAVAAGKDLGGSPARKDLVLYFGASGYGKTTAALRLYAVRFQRGGQCTMIDPTGRYGQIGRVVRSSAEWVAAMRAAGRSPVSLVYQPHDPEGADVGRFWAALYRQGRHLCLCDELQNFGNAQKIQPGLHKLISMGRHQQVSLLATVRTPPEMPKVARGNYETVYTFRQTDPDYAKQLNDGFFRLRGGAELIQRLPRLHFLRVTADGNVSQGRIG